MPRNKLVDLNNHLFETLERLNDEDLVGEQLEVEIRRAKAIAAVGTVIVNNSNVALRAVTYRAEYGKTNEELPDMLKIENKKEAIQPL